MYSITKHCIVLIATATSYKACTSNGCHVLGLLSTITVFSVNSCRYSGAHIFPLPDKVCSVLMDKTSQRADGDHYDMGVIFNCTAPLLKPCKFETPEGCSFSW